LKIDTRDMVNVTEANKRGVSWLVREAEEGRTLLIVKNSEPSVVVTSIANMTRLERIDEATEDLRLLAAALVRMAADDGVRHELDDVLAEFGIETND
jgi:prevent-host-death family protein